MALPRPGRGGRVLGAFVLRAPEAHINLRRAAGDGAQYGAAVPVHVPSFATFNEVAIEKVLSTVIGKLRRFLIARHCLIRPRWCFS